MNDARRADADPTGAPQPSRVPVSEDTGLVDWLQATADTLGVPAVAVPGFVDAVLDLTSDVAHGLARPAAPLAAYLLGAAVASGLTLDEGLRRIRARLG
jgi:hypothetical protein